MPSSLHQLITSVSLLKLDTVTSSLWTQAGLVQDAAIRLRFQEFDRNQVVVGRIIRLATRNDPRNFHESGKREITIQWSSEAFGTIQVHVALLPQQYLEAIAAHAMSRMVSVRGEINGKGRFWYLQNPADFSVPP